MADMAIAIKIAGEDAASGPIGAVHKALGGLGGAATAAAAGVAVGVAAIGALGVKGVMAAGELQQSVANISTIKPNIDTSAVFASLNEMSTRVPQSSKELGDALYNVFSSVDVSQAQALNLVETFAKGAVGAQTDAATFGTSVLGVMNAYGLAAEDAGHISDIFFNTVNAGVVTGQELASSLGPVTQSAKSAGVSLDELGGLIAGVTKEGGPAAQNINNLNNFLQKVTTVEAQKAMHQLGVATTDATGAFRPTTDVLTDLKGRLEGMTEAGRASALQDIFPDAQARTGAATLLSQLDFVKGAIDTNIASSGSAASAYQKMSETFASQSTLLGNTFTSILTTVGAEILPVITPLISAFAKELPLAFEQAKVAFTAVQTAVAPFIAAFQTALPSILEFAGLIGERLQIMGQIIGKVLGGDIKGAFALFQGDLSANTGKIASTLAGWGTAFLGWIGPMIPPLLAQLRGMGAEVVGWLAGQAVGLIESLASWAAAFIDWVAPQVEPLLRELGHLTEQFFSWIADQLPSILSKLGEWALAFVSWVAPLIPPLIGEFVKLQLEMMGWVKDRVPDIIAQLLEWGAAFIGWIAKDVLPGLPGELATIGTALLTWVAETAPVIIAQLLEWGKAFIDWVAADVLPVLGPALDTVAAAISGWIAATAGSISTWAVDMGSSMVRGFISGLAGLAGELQSAIGSAISSIHIDSGPFHLSSGGFRIDAPSMPSISLPSFGGGGGGTVGDGSSGPGGIRNNPATGQPRAGGGPVFAGMSHLVGELGPELFVPSSSGSIVPNNRLGGGGTVVINLNGTYLGDDRTLLRNLARELKPELDRLIEMRAV